MSDSLIRVTSVTADQLNNWLELLRPTLHLAGVPALHIADYDDVNESAPTPLLYAVRSIAKENVSSSAFLSLLDGNPFVIQHVTAELCFNWNPQLLGSSDIVTVESSELVKGQILSKRVRLDDFLSSLRQSGKSKTAWRLKVRFYESKPCCCSLSPGLAHRQDIRSSKTRPLC